jgi:hypothetical protein
VREDSESAGDQTPGFERIRLTMTAPAVRLGALSVPARIVIWLRACACRGDGQTSCPMAAHVVVQLGRFFETAQIAHLATHSVSLVGGWPEPDTAGTLTVLVGAAEVRTRIAEKGPRHLRLVPVYGAAWPAGAERAWLEAVRDSLPREDHGPRSPAK